METNQRTVFGIVQSSIAKTILASVVALICSLQPGISRAQTAAKIYTPLDFIWGDGAVGSNWNSFARFETN